MIQTLNKSENKIELEQNDSMIKTNTDCEKNHSNDITTPKLKWNQNLCKCGNIKDYRSKVCKPCRLNRYTNETHKICIECKKDLSISKFSKRPAERNGYISRCKKCHREKMKNWRLLNPETYKKTNERWRINNPEKTKRMLTRQRWRSMGLDVNEVENYFSQHNNKCEICGKAQTGKSLAVDHCHKTNKFRGLLCSNCNLGLGYFYDNLNLLDKAKEYLIKKKDRPN